MINYTLYFLVVLIVLYVCIHLSRQGNSSQEGFSVIPRDNYFETKHTTQDVYDEFYCFFCDDLFFNETYMQSLAEHILGYQNNVYNNHLVLGMKHGGHLNVMLDNIMKTQSALTYKDMYKKCKMNYKDQNYTYLEDADSYFNYEPYTFTHISVIDDELYMIHDLKGYLYNCSEWLIHKGYLFIEVFDTIHDFQIGFHKYNLDSRFLKKYVYSKNLVQHNSSNDSFTLVEKLKSKQDKNKTRINHIQLNYYANDYIIDLCEGLGMKLTNDIHILPGNSKRLLVFQKTM